MVPTVAPPRKMKPVRAVHGLCFHFPVSSRFDGQPIARLSPSPPMPANHQFQHPTYQQPSTINTSTTTYPRRNHRGSPSPCRQTHLTGGWRWQCRRRRDLERVPGGRLQCPAGAPAAVAPPPLRALRHASRVLWLHGTELVKIPLPRRHRFARARTLTTHVHPRQP